MTSEYLKEIRKSNTLFCILFISRWSEGQTVKKRKKIFLTWGLPGK